MRLNCNVSDPRASQWALYAKAHEQYRAVAPDCWPYVLPGDTDLHLTGWEEISVCSRPTNLKRLFTVNLTDIICNFFQSDFAVLFRSVLERKAGDLDISAFWHTDDGPEAHLRIMVPLTDSDGGTAIISLGETERIGYAPVRIGDRLASLAGFGDYTPYLVSPRVGEALIFQSTRVLHRAVPPVSGVRKVFQIGLIPWNEPWWKFEEEHGAALKNNASGFPVYECP